MLSHTFGGVPISADRLLRSNFASLADEFSIYAPTASSPAAVAAQLEATSKTASMAVDGDCEARTSAQDVRCAASVWMVSLLTYCGGRHPRLLSILGEIQDSLSHLLGDANELTQEMASRGVSIVYSLGDEETQKRLVEALVGVLQGGVKAKQAVKLSGETQVFGDDSALRSQGQVFGDDSAMRSQGEGLSTYKELPGNISGSARSDLQVFGDDSAMRSQGEGLSTYKELCSLATDLGQPDLIYKFMDLAHHQQAMNTRRGAAFGFAGIAKLAGEQLTSHRVQDAMGHIWRSLVDDPKKTVDEHFTPIMKELLREMGGRLWRNRQAACSALGDLLQGRRWVEVKEHLGPVWSMMLRCLDDIKETVRSQAETLARVVRGLSLRLVDPAHVTASDCTEAVAMLLPLLLEEGLGSSVKELSKAAGAEHLRPHLAPLVQAMLEALSNLEDARLNYIEQHAERMGMDSDKLDNARVNASRSSPMGDTLDLCARFADPGSLTQLVPVLTGLVKGGVGLNTKMLVPVLTGLVMGGVGLNTKMLVPVLTGLVKGGVGLTTKMLVPVLTWLVMGGVGLNTKVRLVPVLYFIIFKYLEMVVFICVSLLFRSDAGSVQMLVPVLTGLVKGGVGLNTKMLVPVLTGLVMGGVGLNTKCARFADPGSVQMLVPVLTGLVKGGVGLNTMVGTARFIRNLVARATDDIKPHTPALVKALTSGCRSERSGAVRKAYAGASAQLLKSERSGAVCKASTGASAQLLKYAGPKRVEKTVTEAVEMYSQPSADSDSRYVGGLILRELLRAAPELFQEYAAQPSADSVSRYVGGLILRELLRAAPKLFQEYAAQVLPLAFGAKMDDDSSAAAIWKEVWEEGVSSEAGAVRLYGSEIVGVLTEGLASSQWGRKKACAEAIVQMTQLGSDVLVGPNAVRLTDSLLMELGGRLWDGKEKLLDALGALAPSAQASLEPTPGHLKILEVSPPLLEAIQKNCAPPEAKVAKPVTSAEGEEDEVQDKPWPLVECILCLSAAFSHVGKEVVGDAPVDVSALAVAEAQGCQLREKAAKNVVEEFMSPSKKRAASDEFEEGTPSPAKNIRSKVQPAYGVPLSRQQGLAEALEVVLKAQMPWQQRLAAIQAMQALVKRSLLIKLPLTTMAGWCNKVVPDIATIATDIKIQTVRSVSLACLEVLASAAGAKENPAGEGMLLEAQAVDCAIAAADAVMESDKNAAVVAAASKVKELLVPHALGPTTMDT
eukprot:gene21409-28366_t